MTTLKNRKGFTLVELIVVIAVLALLAVGAVMAITGIQRNARMTTNRNAANEMVDAFNRHNVIAPVTAGGGVPGRVSSLPGMAVGHTVWLHPPMVTGGDSVAISLAFDGLARWNQVSSWVSWNSAAGVWSILPNASFDVPAATGG